MPQFNSTHTGADIDGAVTKALSLAALGIGAQTNVATVTDLNSAPDGAFFSAALTAANNPSGSSAVIGWTSAYQNDRKVQVAINVGDDRFYYRRMLNTWQPWVEILSEGNADAKSLVRYQGTVEEVTQGDTATDVDLETGIYKVNYPGTSDLLLHLKSQESSSAKTVQLRFDYRGRVFFRMARDTPTQYDGILPREQELFHSANDGGIERGSNANGEYVKFPDGTLYCGLYLTTSASAGVTWTYPHAFTGFVRLGGTVNTSSTANVEAVQIPTISNTQAEINAISSAGSRVSRNVWLTAIGRWK